MTPVVRTGRRCVRVQVTGSAVVDDGVRDTQSCACPPSGDPEPTPRSPSRCPLPVIDPVDHCIIMSACSSARAEEGN